jgi:hypothetical protein
MSKTYLKSDHFIGGGSESADRRATEAQVLEDAERLIAAWNEHQAKRTPTNE